MDQNLVTKSYGEHHIDIVYTSLLKFGNGKCNEIFEILDF